MTTSDDIMNQVWEGLGQASAARRSRSFASQKQASVVSTKAPNNTPYTHRPPTVLSHRTYSVASSRKPPSTLPAHHHSAHSNASNKKAFNYKDTSDVMPKDVFDESDDNETIGSVEFNEPPQKTPVPPVRHSILNGNNSKVGPAHHNEQNGHSHHVSVQNGHSHQGSRQNGHSHQATLQHGHSVNVQKGNSHHTTTHATHSHHPNIQIEHVHHVKNVHHEAPPKAHLHSHTNGKEIEVGGIPKAASVVSTAHHATPHHTIPHHSSTHHTMNHRQARQLLKSSSNKQHSIRSGRSSVISPHYRSHKSSRSQSFVSGRSYDSRSITPTPHIHESHRYEYDYSETEGSRTPVPDDYLSTRKSSMTLLPQNVIDQEVNTPFTSRATSVKSLQRLKTAPTTTIGNISYNEMAKRLEFELAKKNIEKHFKRAVSIDMSIEQQLAHIPDEPADDSSSVTSYQSDFNESSKHSVHNLHQHMKSPTPLDIELITPMSTRAPSMLSLRPSLSKNKFEIKHYSLKRPLSVKNFRVSQLAVSTKNRLAPLPPTRSNTILENRKSLLSPIAGTRSSQAGSNSRPISVAESKAASDGTKQTKRENIRFLVRDEKTITCCNCGCHHVFVSGLPNIKMSVLTKDINPTPTYQQSRRSSVSTLTGFDKLTVNEKRKYFS
uniref:Dual-specificity kinase n=1 Tax=Rhabditophanes sp. KR3021 TaxID=114890 RepID=A0AC35TYS0_9BILA